MEFLDLDFQYIGQGAGQEVAGEAQEQGGTV